MQTKIFTIEDWTNDDCLMVQNTFEIIEGRHTLLLLAAFGLEGEMSFGRLKKELCINSKTLSYRLRRLENAGIVTNRRVYEGKVEKSYYSLNKASDELLELLKAFRAYSKALQ